MEKEIKTYATLFGGEELDVKFVNGESETVKIRQLPIRAFADLAINIDNEPKLVELFTGFNSEKVDAISPESWAKILEMGEKLNHDPFSAWLKRKVARAAQMQNLVGASGANS